MSSILPGVPARIDPGPALKQCRHGWTLYLPHDQYIGRALDVYGEYSEGEAHVFAQLLKPGQTVVEAGANMGAHTVLLATVAAALEAAGLKGATPTQEVIADLAELAGRTLASLTSVRRAAAE